MGLLSVPGAVGCGGVKVVVSTDVVPFCSVSAAKSRGAGIESSARVRYACLQAFVLRACEQVVLRSRLDHLAKHVSRVLQHALDVTGLLEVVLVRQDHVKAIAGGPRVAYIGGGNRKGVDGILTAVEILDHSHVKILPSRNWKGGRARTGRSLNY